MFLSLIAAASKAYFSDVPPHLRGSLLEIEMVRRGDKPGGLLFVKAKFLAPTLVFLAAAGLPHVVEGLDQNTSFRHIAPHSRQQLLLDRYFKIFYARTPAYLRILHKAGRSGGHALGECLGYPECCVRFVVENDKLQHVPLFGLFRQTNLVSMAVQGSEHLHFSCNTFLRESDLSSYGPFSLIAHYPCCLSCAKTQVIARQAYDIATNMWPVWAMNLARQLKSPVLFWDDRYWPPNYWAEYVGVSFLEGEVLGGGSTIVGHGVRVGGDRTPGGEIPANIDRCQVSREIVTCYSGGRVKVSIPVAMTGMAYVLDWRNGKTAHGIAV